MHQTRRIPIVELNDYLTCKLCKGYFIDATTIIECLHTFCRSCIVRYLGKNKYCPVCDVQVHKTKPLLNIRPDKTLQDIVYKLVPRLFQNEMCRRREFYASHPEARPSNLEQCGEASYQHILSPDETICLSLNYHGSTAPPRYLRCPAAVSVVHLQKLLRSKYDLTEQHRVDVLHNQDCLNSYLTLMDIAYIYLWRRKGPLELTYRIYENTKTLASETDTPKSLTSPEDGSEDGAGQDKAKSEWKEVQLRISENGEMCFTGIDDCIILNEQVAKCQGDQQPAACTPPNKSEEKTCIDAEPKVASKPTLEPLPKVSGGDWSILKQKKDLPALKLIGKEVTTTTTSIQSTIAPIKNTFVSVSTSSNGGLNNKCVTPVMGLTTNSTLPASVTTSCNTSTTDKSVASSATSDVTISTHSLVNSVSDNRKHKMPNNLEGEPAVKQLKQTVLNHSLGIHNLSNNHPLKRHSQVRKSTESISSVELKAPVCTSACSTAPSVSGSCTVSSNVSVNSVPSSSTFSKQTVINKQMNNASMSTRLSAPTTLPQKWPPNKTPTTNLPCYAPKTTYAPVINIPKVQASTSVARIDQKSVTSPQLTPIPNNKATAKTKSTSPIGYKTLRDPPKTWNPQISRANLLKSPDPKYGDSKNIRPAKFFKMRNNMPRYLGNPASGVKPLYQVQNSPEKDKNVDAEETAAAKPDKPEFKKHSIVKIDPKTLKPISEKAPEASSLSHQADLKINTSSVPIFNPLKLQSSPKSERKSPQSPKQKSASPSSKRDKLNLSYTPTNPFIPNLSSPTLSPNQFLYPPGPPGFPTYDPRIMAAYHSLLYGQRMPYPPGPLPGLSLDLNQRKTFDLPAPTSPKVPTLSYSPKGQGSPIGEPVSPKPIPPSSPKPTLLEPNAPHRSLHTKSNVSKRAGKESAKNEKSLQNAVEKLTQNRVKELIKSEGVAKTPIRASEKAVEVNNSSVVGEGLESKQVNNSIHKAVENGDKLSKSDQGLQQDKNLKKEPMTNSKAKNETGAALENSPSVQNCNESKLVKKETATKKESKEKGASKNVSNNNNTESVSLLVSDAKKK